MKINPKVRYVLNIFFLIIAFVSTYTYAMFQGGFVSWFLFYSVFFILLISLLVIFFPFSSLSVLRERNKRVFKCGEKIIVTIRINRKVRSPFIYLFVQDQLFDHSNKDMNPSGGGKLFFFSFKKELTYSYEVELLDRGEYRFGCIELKTGDFFGLFYRTKKVNLNDTVLVYPKYQGIYSWKIFNDGDSLAINSTRDLGEDVTSISGVRDYVPGDRLYSINWKASARTNKLMTKEFEGDNGQNYLLILDCALPEQTYRANLLFEKAIQFTASIIRFSLQSKTMVGLVTVGDHVQRLPIQCTDEHQVKLFQHLARLKCAHETRLVESLDDLLLKTNPSAATVIIISSSVAVDTIKRLTDLNLQKVKVVYCLITTKQNSDEKKRFIEKMKKINALLYVMQSESFNDDLKAGETNGR